MQLCSLHIVSMLIGPLTLASTNQYQHSWSVW